MGQLTLVFPLPTPRRTTKAQQAAGVLATVHRLPSRLVLFRCPYCESGETLDPCAHEQVHNLRWCAGHVGPVALIGGEWHAMRASEYADWAEATGYDCDCGDWES